jgi:hypothetical protein
MEIANESPRFKEQALALAESWLTLANIIDSVLTRLIQRSLDGNDANH